MTDIDMISEPAPVEGNWQVMAPGEIEGLRSAFPSVGQISACSDQTRGRKLSLTHYREDVELIELFDTGWQPANVRSAYLRQGNMLYWLNGSSPPIHEINRVAGIRFREDQDDPNRELYLRWFCFFVRGEEGPFLIVDSADHPFVSPDPDLRAKLGEKIRDIRHYSFDPASGSRASASVLYADNLFHADFIIQPSGMVEMIDDTPLGEFRGSAIPAPLVIDDIEQGDISGAESDELDEGDEDAADAFTRKAGPAPAANGADGPQLSDAPTHAQLAAKLLRDAAAFFQTIGEQNEELSDQMAENSSVFRQVADLVENDPLARVNEETPAGSSEGEES